MPKKVFALVFVSLFILSGCGTTLTEEEYKQSLGQAVCVAVDELNQAGALADPEKFTPGFESAVKEAVDGMGYSEREWLRAKEKYFTPEEHEKLMKLHFTWCLLGDAFSE